MKILVVDDSKAMRMIVIRTLRQSGVDITELRAGADTTPFGFVTSESNPVMREQALCAGAQFLLTKPFDSARFAEVIGSMVS